MSGQARISNLFAEKKAFVAYLTAGDGGIKQTFAAAMALIEGGISMLEIGMPFSDPIADGGVIQRAAARALSAGTTLNDIFWLTEEIRKHSEVPLILFSYLNPLLAHFNYSFFQRAAHAGLDGLLLVDCPLEESTFFREQCIAHALSPIFIVAPTTSLARLRAMNSLGTGFLYYACQKGTTGLRAALPADFAEKIQFIKAEVTLPIVTGFGISERAMAEQVLQHAEGVVVGSLFVKALEEGRSLAELTRLARDVNPLGQ